MPKNITGLTYEDKTTNAFIHIAQTLKRAPAPPPQPKINNTLNQGVTKNDITKSRVHTKNDAPKPRVHIKDDTSTPRVDTTTMQQDIQTNIPTYSKTSTMIKL